MTKRNPKREEALFDVVVGLNDVYVVLIGRGDMDGLKVLALCYRKCNMPERADKILREVKLLTKLRTSVPDGGIIRGNSTGYGGTDETNPNPIDIGGAPAGCLRAGRPEVCGAP